MLHSAKSKIKCKKKFLVLVNLQNSKEAEALASAYNTPYNQRGNQPRDNDMPPSYEDLPPNYDNARKNQ